MFQSQVWLLYKVKVWISECISLIYVSAKAVLMFSSIVDILESKLILKQSKWHDFIISNK